MYLSAIKVSMCACVYLYKKHEFSMAFGKCCGGCGRGGCALWHATQFGWSCRLLLLLLPVSPGVVGVFLARAAIWRNVYDTTQSHATLHKETERERYRKERRGKSESASGRGSADERLNANANDEGEGEREEHSAAPKLEATSRSTDATRCSVGSGNR